VLTLQAVPGIPEIRPGDDLSRILVDALEGSGLTPRDDDVLVVSSKILSKAEGRYVDLSTVTPSERARRIAAEIDKPVELVEVILSESRDILRTRPGLIIVEHRLGMVMANAGVDQSNVDAEHPGTTVLLLPEDPDASSAAMRAALRDRYGVDVAVVVSDSAGRAWRNGIVGFAIGADGLPALLDLRGERDRQGRPLAVTQVGLADEIAAAAALIMGEADEGMPAILMRGLAWSGASCSAASLLRSWDEDLFR
jgi:coenzyme F420-0:L-glutamate ligase/coenzyme F420-1:gamma-L-glutamate ligase